MKCMCRTERCSKGDVNVGIMQYNYRSQVLARQVDVTIVYPTDRLYIDSIPRIKRPNRPEPKNRFPYREGMKFQTIYLLHGGGDDSTLTYRYTNAERFAQENQVMLVTPSLVDSYFVNTSYGVDYLTFLTEELPVVARTLFASSEKREDNFIVGYAMGGNGAMGAAIVRPDLYSECVSISGGTGLTLDTQRIVGMMKSHYYAHKPIHDATFGDPDALEGSRFDIYSIVKKNLEQGIPMPKFHLVGGSEEFVIERIRGDRDKFAELGIDIHYEEPVGYAHEFRLWEDYLQIVMNQWLSLKREPIYNEG